MSESPSVEAQEAPQTAKAIADTLNVPFDKDIIGYVKLKTELKKQEALQSQLPQDDQAFNKLINDVVTAQGLVTTETQLETGTKREINWSSLEETGKKAFIAAIINKIQNPGAVVEPAVVGGEAIAGEGGVAAVEVSASAPTEKQESHEANFDKFERQDAYAIYGFAKARQNEAIKREASTSAELIALQARKGEIEKSLGLGQEFANQAKEVLLKYVAYIAAERAYVEVTPKESKSQIIEAKRPQFWKLQTFRLDKGGNIIAPSGGESQVTKDGKTTYEKKPVVLFKADAIQQQLQPLLNLAGITLDKLPKFLEQNDGKIKSAYEGYGKAKTNGNPNLIAYDKFNGYTELIKNPKYKGIKDKPLTQLLTEQTEIDKQIQKKINANLEAKRDIATRTKQVSHAAKYLLMHEAVYGIKNMQKRADPQNPDHLIDKRAPMAWPNRHTFHDSKGNKGTDPVRYNTESVVTTQMVEVSNKEDGTTEYLPVKLKIPERPDFFDRTAVDASAKRIIDAVVPSGTRDKKVGTDIFADAGVKKDEMPQWLEKGIFFLRGPLGGQEGQLYNVIERNNGNNEKLRRSDLYSKLVGDFQAMEATQQAPYKLAAQANLPANMPQ